MVVKTKICGVTTVDDALMVARAGADAVGLNFFAGPRKIDVDLADRMLSALPPMITVVALADVSRGCVPADVLGLLDRHRVSHVQMYGHVSGELVAQLRRDGFRPIYVVHVDGPAFRETVQTLLDAGPASRPSAILLDTADDHRAGGTGKPVDWESVRQVRESGAMAGWPPIILAGGLRPENVGQAIAAVKPWAVDVASGVESSPGRKDRDRVRAFIEAVNHQPSAVSHQPSAKGFKRSSNEKHGS